MGLYVGFAGGTGNPFHPITEEPMRKLKLDLTRLEVTSFAAASETEERGTVQAHDPPKPTRYELTCQWTCGFTFCDEWTCHFSCNCV